jgi:ATP-dependent Lhr-like helicase
MRVRFMKGGYVGSIEESFISKLKPGDAFSLAGRVLEFVQVKEMEVYVRRSSARDVRVPSWLGGRLPLSQSLSAILREVYERAGADPGFSTESKAIQPIIELQRRLSAVPARDELLIEFITTRDGHHLFLYPFEGRFVHEVIGSLLAFRLSRLAPITFSIAMNDYGLELLSDQPPPLPLPHPAEEFWKTLFSTENLLSDLQQSINSTEMAKRRFRDIAGIAGLVFQGFPGKFKSNRHLQASSQLFFGVFTDYEPDNLLLRQAYQEVFDFQIEEARLRQALERVQAGRIVFRICDRLTPFCFPIKVDSLREQLSSEKLEDRVRKMQAQLERAGDRE